MEINSIPETVDTTEGTDTPVRDLSPSPGSAAVAVSEADLQSLTDGILNDIGEWRNTGPRGSEEWRCRYCGGILPQKSHEVYGADLHSEDCPVLLAISIQPNTEVKS